jgi:tetratricopeptide (TPR) repeat protein
MCLVGRERKDRSIRKSLAASFLAIVFSFSTSAILSQSHPASKVAPPAGDLSQARKLLDTPRWREAEPVVKSYLERKPSSVDAHALLGLILYRQDQPRDSMAEFIRASELGELTAFDLRIFALDCAAIPDLPEAEKWLLRSLEIDNRDAATWEALGHIRFEQQKYEETIEALNHALEIAPRTVSSQSMIGLANELLAHPEAALAAYRTAIEWQANAADFDPVPYLGTGRVLLAEDRAAAAIVPLRKAAASSHATSEAHELLGLAYSKMERNGEAATELETAIRLDPKSARLHLMLARIYRSLGETAKAASEQARYSELKAGAAQ